ncbi:MAG: AraC family transcriptional regulator [Lentihominibacter sp.]|jgi:AraC-like DNA-binding protein
MILTEPKLEYKAGFPFEAELCRIGKTLPHRHPTELELIYVFEGSIRIRVAEQEAVLSKGDVHSIDFYDIHFLENAANGDDCAENDNLVLLLHLDLSKLPCWEELQPVFFACETTHCFPYQEGAMSRVKDLILSLAYVYFRGESGDFSESVDELIRILRKYFNWFNYNNHDEFMNIDLYNRFERILTYILDNYREKISVSQLAEKENINRNYFSQFLSKTVFLSFGNMVNFIRCYNAEPLLVATDMSISDIAFECGFSDPKYFYAAFKQLWHRTPSEHRCLYRRQYASAMAEIESMRTTKSGTITDEAAALIIKDYITEWHLTKTSSPVSLGYQA